MGLMAKIACEIALQRTQMSAMQILDRMRPLLAYDESLNKYPCFVM